MFITNGPVAALCCDSGVRNREKEEVWENALPTIRMLTYGGVH